MNASVLLNNCCCRVCVELPSSHQYGSSNIPTFGYTAANAAIAFSFILPCFIKIRGRVVGRKFHPFRTVKSKPTGTSLVTQWLRILLPMQGTWVRALVWEDPTCRGATKPLGRNYWACALEHTSHNYWARVPQLLKPARLEPMLCNKRSHRNEKPAHHNEE